MLRIAFISAGLAATAFGQVNLSGFATADNAFEASISTSPTDPGTPWFSGNSWPQTFVGSSIALNPGAYYLHVRAQDFGRPEMFIGLFQFDGPNGVFAGGGQTVLTNTTDWVVSTSGFGLNTAAPVDLGPNGGATWGNFPQMGSARFIWAPEYANGVAFFSTRFTVLPAPGAFAALGGLVVLARRRR